MEFYTWATVLIELLMIAMTIHVLHYSGFTKQQKIWFVLTFASVMVCSIAEYAVHGVAYRTIFNIPLTVLTVIQFSLSPLLAVFFSGALGLHKEAKKAVKVFALNALVEISAVPFGLIFYFDDAGYHRGGFFWIYLVCYIVALIYLIVSMVVVGKRFRHRDSLTIVMIVVILVAGIAPMTLFNIHIAYISIGLGASLCYIYYNDLVQDDIMDDLIANQKKMSQMQTHTISGLSNLIESRDADTGGHVARTCRTVKAIAETARANGVHGDEIDDRFITMLYTLAPMHDVGKITVPDAILRKPGRLTDEEFGQIKLHAAAGGKIVRQILDGIADEEYINFASDIASYHHEKWDGTGYPEGLSGNAIPLCARIMAIADVYDALVSERCYKTAMSENEALEIIKSESGKHFEPELVTMFLLSKETGKKEE